MFGNLREELNTIASSPAARRSRSHASMLVRAKPSAEAS